MNLARKASLIWATGIAIFSLFFGSGNVVFPLTLGVESGNMINLAFLGLCVTAIGGPLLGLFAAMLYEADFKKFFFTIGKVPGYFLVILIICLIGPFGAMPRCFVVGYAAINSYFPDLTLSMFNVLAGIMTVLLVWRKDYILPILGGILSPALLISLIVIIIYGILSPGDIGASLMTNQGAMWAGFVVGYDTLDLLASVFFAVAVWGMLKDNLPSNNYKLLGKYYLAASLLGGTLLAIVYYGLSYAAAKHAGVLGDTPSQEILSTLAISLLGKKLSIFANIAVALACLTTVMGLATTIADVLQLEFKDTKFVTNFKYNYDVFVIGVVGVAVIIANHGFANIMNVVHPIMVVCYPAIIVLTICNILHKLHGFNFIKIPVFTAFVLSMAYTIISPAHAAASANLNTAPELVELKMGGFEENTIFPDKVKLHNNKDYLFILENNNSYPVSFNCTDFTQSIHTKYIRGTSSITRDTIFIPANSKVQWHFAVNNTGQYNYFMRAGGNNVTSNMGEIFIS